MNYQPMKGAAVVLVWMLLSGCGASPLVIAIGRTACAAFIAGTQLECAPEHQVCEEAP